MIHWNLARNCKKSILQFFLLIPVGYFQFLTLWIKNSSFSTCDIWHTCGTWIQNQIKYSNLWVNSDSFWCLFGFQHHIPIVWSSCLMNLAAMVHVPFCISSSRSALFFNKSHVLIKKMENVFSLIESKVATSVPNMKSNMLFGIRRK